MLNIKLAFLAALPSKLGHARPLMLGHAWCQVEAGLITMHCLKLWVSGNTIDIESLQNRLLKVCYMPVTSAGLPRVSFFFSFLFFVAAAINSTNEANKAGGTCH